MITRVLLTSSVLTVVALTLLIAGCGGPPPVGGLSAEELLARGKESYKKEKYLKAIEYFQALVYNYPGAALVDTAQYYLGLSYFGNEEYEVAQVEFNRLAVNYPSSAYFVPALFMKAVCLFESTPGHYGLDQTSLEKAIKQFEDFLIDFPDSEMAADARHYLEVAYSRLARKYYQAGLVYKHMGLPKAAEVYFQQVIDDFTDTDWGAKAAYRYGEMEYELERYDQAERRFSDFATVFPDHEWAAKAKEQAAKAAFNGAMQAIDSGDFAAAQSRLRKLIQNHPESDVARKANDYLRKIDEEVEETQVHVGDAGS